MAVIPFYIFTIDADGKEDVLVQVRDFTALVVLVDLDNILG